jgi:monothiol glutaredoxin
MNKLNTKLLSSNFLKYKIFSKKFSSFSTKFIINKIFSSNKLGTLSFYKAGIHNFTTESKPESDDIHSDFKPKIKTEINNENVMKIIDEWVKNYDVVIFMKGTREMPRCGFSNYVVQILNFYNVKNAKVVNVLENPLIRESVKEYSNWPTYPQLYVKGSLVGGCDIIKEMHENGTFKELVEREGITSP